MDPVVAPLMCSVAVVFLTPLIFAAFYAGGRGRPSALAKLKATLLILKLSKEKDDCELRLTDSVLAENDLHEEVDELKTRITNLELTSRRSKKCSKRDEVRKIRKDLIEREQRLTSLKAETSNRRSQLNYVQDQLLKARASKTDSSSKSDVESSEQGLLAITERAMARSRKLVERCERIVLEQERSVVRADPIKPGTLSARYWNQLVEYERFIVKSQLDSARRRSGVLNRFLMRLNNCSLYVSKAALTFSNNVTDLCGTFDPNVDRAFSRLELAAKQARLTAQMVTTAELDLEDSLGAENKKLQNLMDFLDSGDFSAEVKDGAALKKTTIEESIEQLESNLGLLKQKNLTLQQSMFYVDIVIIRLSILKLLINAMPDSKKSIRQQYVDLSNSLCAYLHSSALSQDKGVPHDFVIRLHRLEQTALMRYIVIAKSEQEISDRKALEKLKKDVAEITGAIDAERANAVQSIERWSSMADSAENQKQEALLTVAQGRQARCSEILSLTEKTLDVLNITVAAIERRTDKSKAS